MSKANSFENVNDKAFEQVKERDVFEDGSEVEPSVENVWGVYGDFKLVGNGEVTNVFCGKYIRLKGCLRVDLHNLITLDGVNYAGKVFTRKVHHWCNKPSCPVCFKSGWAVREAGNIEGRLAEASRRFGLVEHIVASVPVRDYGLTYEALRKKVVKILRSRGIVGGVLIFHGFRYDLREGWYWSPHFHVLGFVLGGYARCRNCKRKWNCLRGCGDFDDRAWQGFEKDKYFVKVFPKRKTVFGTAFYQLNHATIRLGVRRFHVVTWFGSCGNRKFKSANLDSEVKCPACESEMVRSVYVGKRYIVKDVGHADYVPWFVFDEFDEDGNPNFIDIR